MSDNHKCNCNTTDDALYERLKEIIISLKDKQGALIPILQSTQNLFGYIPRESIVLISEMLNEPLSKIYGVITFYSFFSLNPRGKYLIRVCMGTACYVGGAENVLNTLKLQLGIDIGETTPDLLFSLEVGRCFGACGLAPIILINDDVHQWVKTSDIARIIKSYRQLESKSS